MKKVYLFANIYKKKHFFSTFLDFFIYIAKKKKKKIPVVNKYHQNKVLSV
ncbi:unnamed protein product [Staurois parvus]|uniref:Uncharacterized protein n=1 Tax=Staurois parvus TaxID=386267 RepID=A0ABN9DXG3_9NEOB|nr:unnamed protein product [Staurois parvus]